MLAGDVFKVNFQLDDVIDEAAYPELQGYVADDGSAYGDRGNGLTYGWLDGNLSPDTQSETRNRNSGAAPDERYDTLNHMIKGDQHSWQIDLPNGAYHIYLVSGDPNHTDQIEDIQLISGANSLLLDDPDGQDNWDEYTVEEFVVVDDRLRLYPSLSGSNQKLAFLEITQLSQPEPPAITSGLVTDVGSFSATLAGMITDTGNEDPAVTLFYGTTDHGTTTGWTDSVALGVQSGDVSAQATDLLPDTTYFFRWRAVNSAGTAWSSVTSSFSTLPLSVAEVETDPAVAIEARSATIAGRVTNVGSETPDVTLYFGTEDGGVESAAWASAVALGAQDGSFATVLEHLNPATTYYYRAAATNAAGTSWQDATRSLTTLTIGLPAVETDAAMDVEALAATMRGRVTDDGNDPPQVQLYWGTADGGTDPTTWQATAELGRQSSEFAWTVGELQHGTTYFYRARVENSAGSAWSNIAEVFTTLTAVPAEVANDPATEVTSTTARLGGHVVNPGNDAPDIRLYYGTTDGGTNAADWQAFIEFPDEYGSFSTTLSGLTADTEYFFRSRSSNAAGIAWAPASASFRTATAPVLLITELMARNETTLTTRLRDAGRTVWPRDGAGLDRTAQSIGRASPPGRIAPDG